MNDLNDQIILVKEEKYLQEKYLRRLAQLEAERNEEESKIKTLQEQLDKELKDVDRLEGISLSGFFFMISGKREDRLEKEKEEAYKAKLLLEESEKRFSELSADITSLNEKLRDLGDVEAKHMTLLKKKEQLIHESNPVLGELLHNLAEQKITWEMELKELDEAEGVALKAESALKDAENALMSARDWGYLDMAGGGMLSTYAKRSHMDEAQTALHEAQYHLKQLQSELADLGKEITSSLEMTDFLNIADYFFDNIFSDWMVQDKITTSATMVDDCLEKLAALLSELKTERIHAIEKLEKVEEERLKYLQ